MKNNLQLLKSSFYKAFGLIVFLCLSNVSTFAQYVCGNITTDTTWTDTVKVSCDITVNNGVTLTINSGTYVEFQGTYTLLVQGRLLAIGTPADTIIFTAANTTDGWRGIRFFDIFTSNDSSKIMYCKLLYGKATGTGLYENGGAFYFNNFSKAIISNCRISNGSANNDGSGIYCFTSSPTISNNIISNNIISNNNGNNGGGICCRSSSPTITNNIISNNMVASGGGGGILCDLNSSPTISNNIISNNTCNNGAGISCGDNSNPTISNNIISNNTSSGYGGGIWCMNCNPTISNNIISNNTGSYGGGISCLNSTPSIYNNTISNNTGDNGGGIYCNEGSPSVINNTIANNYSTSNGGALFVCSNSNPTFINCILWGNTASTNGMQVYLDDETSDPNFYYCDVENDSAAFAVNGSLTYTGFYQNNINSEPIFVTPSGGSGTGFNGVTADWSLQAGSLCIDAGNPVGTYPATDITGNLRISGCIIDIGAYEYQKGFAPPPPFFQNLTICNGQSVTVGSNTYTMSGTYHDTLTSYQGCDSTVTTNLTVENAIDVSTTLIAETITANATGSIYQWIDCNNGFAIIIGETFQSFIATANGNYAVVITQGSCSDTSVCVQITTVGITSIQTEEIAIYPNPVSNEFIIEIKGNNEKINFEILNAMGQVVFKGNIVNKTTVQTSNFALGVYLLKLENGKTFKFKKIIKE
ncbi:MAG: hypothetical protein A2X08_01110 [Bacteroidetes bacterium GWA2_32_17]|nr:MAG: hypothetical protein A2X08_01110 [Bacteroidetes bacterium GWA2_32_17]